MILNYLSFLPLLFYNRSTIWKSTPWWNLVIFFSENNKLLIIFLIVLILIYNSMTSKNTLAILSITDVFNHNSVINLTLPRLKLRNHCKQPSRFYKCNIQQAEQQSSSHKHAGFDCTWCSCTKLWCEILQRNGQSGMETFLSDEKFSNLLTKL